MPTHLGKNRKKAKEKEAQEDKAFLEGMGYKNEAKDKQEPGAVVDEPGDNGVEVGHISNPQEDRSKQGRTEGPVGGFIEIDNEQDEGDRNSRIASEAAGNQKLELLNEWASNILNCLDPEAKQNFHTAAFDAKVVDIGLYILGILNRMHKMGDYFEPDIEVEWEKGTIGYDQELFCEYCKQKITNAQHLQQKFCSNRCSRNYKLRNATGVIYPKSDAAAHESVDQEEKQWEAEQKRLGVMA